MIKVICNVVIPYSSGQVSDNEGVFQSEALFLSRNPLFIRASFLIRKDTKVSFLTLLPFQGANNLFLCTFIISFCLQKERSPRESVPRVECYPLFIRASFLIRKDTKVSFLTLLSFQGANNLSLCTFIISFCPQKERSPRESVPRVECYPLFIRASFGQICKRTQKCENVVVIPYSSGQVSDEADDLASGRWISVVIPYSSGQVSDK